MNSSCFSKVILLLLAVPGAAAGNLRRHRRVPVLQVASNRTEQPKASFVSPKQLSLEDREHLARELQNANSLDCPGRVTHLRLWTSEDDTFVRDIYDGDSFCYMDSLVNIDAVVDSCPQQPIESIKFRGSLGRTVENVDRYFVFGDMPDGEVFGQVIAVGRYRVDAIPFSEDDALGVRGTRYRANFEVLDCSPDPFDEDGSENIAVSTGTGGISILDSLGARRRRAQESQTEVDGKRVVHQSEFDFIYAGLPSGLEQNTFPNHGDLDISYSCDWTVNDDLSMHKVLRDLDDTLFDMKDGLRGMYCPMALYHTESWTRFAHHSPHAVVVIHLRHPVLQWAELNQGELQGHGVTKRQLLHYEYMLMALGKTTLLVRDMRDLADHSPDTVINTNNNFRVVLTTDGDDESWWGEIGLGPGPGESTNAHLNRSICQPKFDDLRASLLEASAKTATWIRAHFLKSDSVYASDFFVKNLKSWHKDPCIATPTATE